MQVRDGSRTVWSSAPAAQRQTRNGSDGGGVGLMEQYQEVSMVPEESRRHDKAVAAVHQGRPVSARYVRGGRRGRGRMLAILIVSTAATAALLLGLWGLSNGVFDRQNPSEDQKAQDARTFEGEAPLPAPAV